MMTTARKTRNICLSAAIAAVALFAVPTAQAALLVDFMPEPASPLAPEFIWDGTSLTVGPGAVGSGFNNPNPGDGESAPQNQDVPGLEVVTPYEIGGVPGGVVNAVAGSTTFYDTTLEISPLAADGAPGVMFGVFVAQKLQGGVFNIWSTDPVDVPETDNPVLLLSGTIASASIAGILGSSTGAVLSARSEIYRRPDLRRDHIRGGPAGVAI